MGLKEFKEAEGFICFLSCHCSCITDTDGPSGQPGILRFPSKSSSISNRELCQMPEQRCSVSTPSRCSSQVSSWSDFQSNSNGNIPYLYSSFFYSASKTQQHCFPSLSCPAESIYRKAGCQISDRSEENKDFKSAFTQRKTFIKYLYLLVLPHHFISFELCHFYYNFFMAILGDQTLRSPGRMLSKSRSVAEWCKL